MTKISMGALIAAVALATGCGTTPNDGQGAGAESRTAQASPVGGHGAHGSPLTDPASPLSKRSVYFDYDSYLVKPEYQSLVQAHARYLAANPNMTILIQGNTDERGSREYNLALGQKRADAVKKALTLLGARDSQVESVSLGEEKPRSEGRDEGAYAENRRGDILYKGEY